MKEQILSSLDNPVQLERLYRENKSAFKQAFNSLYPDLENKELSGFWNARLNFFERRVSAGQWKRSGTYAVFLSYCYYTGEIAFIAINK